MPGTNITIFLHPLQVLAFFLRPETNERLGLHGHGCIIQPHLQPAQLTKLYKECCDEIIAFVESLMYQRLPDGWSMHKQGKDYVLVPPPQSGLPVSTKLY